MKRPMNKLICWLSLMLLCACAPNVQVSYDKSADFSRYRTYAWGKGVPAKNPNLDRQITETIDEQLARKGFTQLDGDPDLVVSYRASTREDTEYTEGQFVSGQGAAYSSIGGQSSADVPMTVTVGTLVVDMYDTKAKRNVWHGVGSEIVGENPEKTTQAIRKGAAAMFEKFPPRRGETER